MHSPPARTPTLRPGFEPASAGMVAQCPGHSSTGPGRDIHLFYCNWSWSVNLTRYFGYRTNKTDPFSRQFQSYTPQPSNSKESGAILYYSKKDSSTRRLYFHKRSWTFYFEYFSWVHAERLPVILYSHVLSRLTIACFRLLHYRWHLISIKQTVQSLEAAFKVQHDCSDVNAVIDVCILSPLLALCWLYNLGVLICNAPAF